MIEPTYAGGITPEIMAMIAKAERDLPSRLDNAGNPLQKGNDYERHLHARYLTLRGYMPQEVKNSLRQLGLEDIPLNKRESYLDDILNSPMVWVKI